MQQIRRGRGFLGVLSYLLDHDDAEYISGTVTPGTARQMTGEFVAISGRRPDISKPVWHNSLRLPAGEHLQAGQWAVIARDYMREMGYLDTSQWVAIRHNNPQGEHIHIVANRVLLDGSIYYGRDDNLQSTRVIAQLEKKHGLTVTREPDIDVNGDLLLPSRAKMKKGEIDKALRTGKAPTRIMLQLIIDEALADKPILWDFVERLHIAGINVRPNIATTGRVNGLAFELNGLSFGGSKLGKKYAWTNLKQSIDYQPERDNQLLQQLKNWAIKNDEIAANRTAGHLSESSTSTQGPDYKRVGPPDEKDDSFTHGISSQAPRFSKDYQSFQQPSNQVSEQSGDTKKSKTHAGVEVGQNQYLRTNHRTNNNNTAVGIAADNPSHKWEHKKMSGNNDINDLKAIVARKKHDADAEAELALKKEQRARQAKKRQTYLTMESTKSNAMTVSPDTNNRFLKLIELAFDKKGNNYYKKSTGELAFYETGDKIICSQAEPDQTTIKAMSQAARAKFGDQWRSFGSEAYIRESWLQAAMMGCNDVGLKPSPDDWDALKKRVADYEQKYGHKPPQFHQKIIDGLHDHEIGLELLALPDGEDSQSDTGSLGSQNNKPEPEFSFANRLNTWRDKQKRKKDANENNRNFPKPSPGH